MPAKLNLVGHRYGRLLVISEVDGVVGEDGRNRVRWDCICECGNNVIAKAESLRSGETSSCGCKIGGLVKHGHARKSGRHELYAVWSSMKDRCYNPNNTHWQHYGGRGITMCDSWRNDFSAFLADMGERPSDKHSIDRIDVNGIYERTNCRWATPSEQASNRRAKRIVRHEVVEGWTIKEIAGYLDLSVSAIRHRLRAGRMLDDLFARELRGRHMIGRTHGRRNLTDRDEAGRFTRKRMNGSVERRDT